MHQNAAGDFQARPWGSAVISPKPRASAAVRPAILSLSEKDQISELRLGNHSLLRHNQEEELN
jgi:hypothetical protein